MTEVRDLLESTADSVEEPAEIPVDRILAAGRRRRHRRRYAVAAAGVATVAAVLAVAVPLTRDAGSPGLTRLVPDGVPAAGGNGVVPTGTGEAICGDVHFDRSELPGRTVTVDNGDWPTEQAADLLALHGWPRAVPFDVARWTQVTDGRAGVLVASLPGTGYRYLPVHRGPNNSWVVGPPCTPR